MTIDEYLKLSEVEQKQFQSPRVCEECASSLVRDGHSMGAIHVVCPTCNMCPDCEDGE